MANKHQVIQAHAEHPDWGSTRIAALLGCHSGYVRATAQRNRIALPSDRVTDPNSVYRLGRTARSLGMSVDDLPVAALLLTEHRARGA